ncbi:hypothetical protein JCM6882_005108 [Rhodosporidiobolus microsporus]
MPRRKRGKKTKNKKKEESKPFPSARSPAPSPPPSLWSPPSLHANTNTSAAPERRVGSVFERKAPGEEMNVRAAKRGRWDVREGEEEGEGDGWEEARHAPPPPPSPPSRSWDGPSWRRPPVPQRPNEQEREREPDDEVLPPTAASYGAHGEYLTPQRRQKKHARESAVVPPTDAYLAASLLPSKRLSPSEVDGTRPTHRNSRASKRPLARPYLATFLEYICSSAAPPDGPSTTTDAGEAPARRPRFLPVVYSSARAPNVLSMLSAIDLIPSSKFLASSSYAPPPNAAPYTPSPSEGDVLRLVFTRELMGLSEADYANDVDTTKDVGRVWEKVGWRGRGRDGEGARRTVLLDDEVGKAAQQPHNHLPIHPFLVHHDEFPVPSSSSSSSYAPAPAPATALDLPLTHPCATDSHLLRTIYLLDLRCETNISSAIRSGLFARVREEARAAVGAAKRAEAEAEGWEGEEEVSEKEVDEEMAARGARVCDRLGIEVRRAWPEGGGWREGLLRREGRWGA